MTLRALASRLRQRVRRARLRRAFRRSVPDLVALVPPDGGEVVVVADLDVGTAASTLARALPSATVVLLHKGANARREDGTLVRLGWSSRGDVVQALLRRPRPCVLVDATTRDRVRTFTDLAAAVASGGHHVVLAPGPSWSRQLDVELSSPGSTVAQARRAELRRALEPVRSPGRLAVHRKLSAHHLALRHDEVEQVLADRFGDWGEVIERRPSYAFGSRAEITDHGRAPDRPRPTTIEVPSLAVRRYDDVTCHLREIAARDNLLLPDTFRHWHAKPLFHRRIVPASPRLGRIDDSVAGGEPTRMEGEFFSFDSAFPVHFGHLMTETISKHWGWQVAVRRNPDVRPLLSHQPGKPAQPAFKRAILEALGVPLDTVAWVTQERPMRVESLVCAMPQLENPVYVDPAIEQTWDALREGLPSTSGPRPERIFVTRRSQSQRRCENTPEVGNFFVDQGFTVIEPETMSYAEQVHVFASARLIAGFAGSGMFNAMFSTRARLVVLASRSYVSANEHLIASVRGIPVDYFWADARVSQPERGFSTDAHRAGFVFPLAEHRADLLSVVRS